METGHWWNMKKLNNKLTSSLLNKKGEMLIETIISIMLFTFLITGVTMVITSATNGLRTTQRAAESAQDTANKMVTASTELSPQDTNIVVSLEVSTSTGSGATPVTVQHSAKIILEEDLVYFYTAP